MDKEDSQSPESKPSTSTAPAEKLKVWQFSGVIGLVAGLAAAVVPITTAITGYYDLKIKEKELDNKIAVEWIDKALDENKSATYRQKYFEALSYVLEGTKLEPWAKQQNARTGFQARREVIASYVKSLGQSDLDKLAGSLGVGTGPDALVGILGMVADARETAQVDAITDKLRDLFHKEF
jgi:hypothetical protein